MDRKPLYVLLIAAAVFLIYTFVIYLSPVLSTTAYYEANVDKPPIILEPNLEDSTPLKAPQDSGESTQVNSLSPTPIHYPVSSKTEQSGGKKVYITIDDGPSAETTNKMLDVLKKYNVKATFFVIGAQIPGNENILKRIHDEGHSIGLHSYTHNIKKIYSNHDVFINEMIQTANEINRVLGIKPDALRFPGGSGGRLSREFLDKLHKADYKIFDWNISAGDGMYPNNPPERILENAINPQQLTSNAILLMHTKPNNQKSCEALPMIIEYYRDHGYEFKVINKDTSEYYFKFK